MEDKKQLANELLDILSRISNTEFTPQDSKDDAVFAFMKSGANNLLWDIKYLVQRTKENRLLDAQKLCGISAHMTEIKKLVFEGVQNE